MNPKRHDPPRHRGARPTTMLLALAACLAACDGDAPDTDSAEGLEIAAVAPDVSVEDLATAQQATEQADAVFVGEVTGIEYQVSEPNERGKRYPFTVVTWDVEDGIKGVDAGESYSARFLGGPMGDKVLIVSEMPKFAIGDRDMMFVVKNGEVGCPLVGGAKGRVQLRLPGELTDGVSRVAREAGWAQRIALQLREDGLDAGPSARSVRASEPFVFAGPQPATPEQMQAVAAQAQARLARVRAPIEETEAERRERLALEANDFNPVLPQ